MIDYESDIFSAVASVVREKFPGAYVVGTELTSAPPNFPAVSIVQSNNAARTEYSTFESLENVVREDYKVETYSNLITGKEAQTKAMTAIISDVFAEFGYERTFCEVVANGDSTINRRISRFTKNNVI